MCLNQTGYKIHSVHCLNIVNHCEKLFPNKSNDMGHTICSRRDWQHAKTYSLSIFCYSSGKLKTSQENNPVYLLGSWTSLLLRWHEIVLSNHLLALQSTLSINVDLHSSENICHLLYAILLPEKQYIYISVYHVRLISPFPSTRLIKSSSTIIYKNILSCI